MESDFATNATFVKNKIVKLPEQNKDGIISGNYKIVEGKSRYEFFLPTYVGVDQLTGNSLYTLNLEDYFITLPDGSKLGNAEGTDISDNESLTSINGTYYTNNTTYALKEFHGSALPKVYGSLPVRYLTNHLLSPPCSPTRWEVKPMMGYTVVNDYRHFTRQLPLRHYECLESGSRGNVRKLGRPYLDRWHSSDKQYDECKQ